MLIRKYTFWLSILSIALCYSDYLGSGFANILLVRGNPLVDSLVLTEPFSSWMTSVHSIKWSGSSALIALRFPAYLFHFATFLAAGLILDWIKSKYVSSHSL
ncbi:hypothetical protein [Paenibacillus pedocola]|uniref:hypothetical protein n=1 Tax=Paenibacillus pedocola TaxID=3242193 RepID=UPI002877605B|nr:hypothetical protein [Paenibacillus typhae]